MRYVITVEHEYLSIEVGAAEAGSVEGRQRALNNALSVVLAQSLRPVLISATGKQPLSLTDLYRLARLLGRTPLRRQRIAFLYDAEKSFESSRFIESIAEENGLTLAAFRTVAEALRWLMREPVAWAGTQPDRWRSRTFGYRV